MHAVLLTLVVSAAPAGNLKVSWLGLELSERPGGEIVVVKADAPAAPAVAAGDRLVTVTSGDHKGTLDGKTLCEVWPMIVGPIGEPVGLRFVRAGKAFDATLTRTDPPGLEKQAQAAVPKKGVPPPTAQQLFETQREMLRAMAMQPPAPCGTGPSAEERKEQDRRFKENSDQVTAFSNRLQQRKTLCDLKWIKAQPEVASVEGSPATGLSVFMKAGGAPVVIDCGE